MGNKTGKFNVPATEKLNKDEAVLNDTEVIVEPSNHVEANGDQPKQESNGVEKTETAPEAKKKNIVSWFKKVSIRKEKKPKAPKENGVKEELVEAPKENGVKDEVVETVKENGNGDVHTEKDETKEEIPEVAVHHDEKEVAPEEVIESKEETPVVNGHEESTEVTEKPAEEQ